MIDRAIFELDGVRAALALLVATDLARALAVAGQAWGLARAVVNLWNGAALADQAGWLALFLACLMARQALLFAQDAYLEGYAAARADELRQRLLDTVFTCGAAVVQARGTGAVSATVLEGVDQVETYIRLILPKLVGVAVVCPVLLLWIFPLDWVSGLIALIMLPVIVMFMVILGRTAQDQAARQHAEFQRMSSHFIDTLRGIDTLKLFGRSKRHAEEVYEVSEQFRQATVDTLRVATLSSAVLDLCATGGLAAVSIMLGFRLMAGDMTLFPSLFVLIVVPEYFKPVREFASDYHASLDGRNALASIRELLDEGEGAEDDEPVAIAPWGDSSSLELRDVAFSYPDYQALAKASFSVQGPLKVGIVGESGAGKSTLVNLLAGFSRPEAGQVLVDGEAVGHLHRPGWQGQALYLPQSPYVFHATLRDNIAFYCPDAPEDRVQDAVRAMGLEGLVDELPSGLDTVVGEGARALSGGQAQRVALARVFLDDARRVLLFDEPTAHLDIETELELKRRMLPLMEGRLVFFATHRLHWMAQMDYILVMEEGRVVQAGTLEELRAVDGAFRRLVRHMGGDER